MKTFFKWLLLGVGVVVLLLLAALATLGWWLPPLAEPQARKALENLGFEVVDLQFKRLGYSGVTINVLALEREGAHIETRAIRLDYSLLGLLFRQQAESLLIEGLDVRVDLPVLLAEIENSGTSSSQKSGPLSIPQNIALPIRDFLLNDSELTLKAKAWEKTLSLTAYLQDGQTTRYLLEASDEQDRLSLTGDIDLDSLQNTSTFRLKSQDPLIWQELLENLQLFQLPQDTSWHSGSFTLEGALRSEVLTPEAWTMLGSLNALQAVFPKGGASIELFNFGTNGDGLNPEKVWAGLFHGQANYNEKAPVHLTWEAATMETLNPESIYAKLEGWQASSDLTQYGLGDTSVSAGPLRLLLDGPWASLRGADALESFALRLIMPESPLELYTGIGSLFGQLGLNIQVGPAQPDRAVEGTLSMKETELNASGATLTAEGLELAIKGEVPTSLALSLSINNGSASWLEGAGSLTGIQGQIMVSNVFEPDLSETQKLTFERFTQGKVHIDKGEINLSLNKPQASENNEATITAGGEFADGRIALRMKFPLDAKKLQGDVDLLLQNVSLSQLAQLFPEFDGKIQGRVSGELPVSVSGGRLILQPGYLEMAAGETGKFSFTKQGWLTQDPSLDPVAFSQDKDLSELMQAPKGAAILTELAVRDLNLTAFRIDILKPGEGDRRIIVHLEGDGSFKGVTIPIVQDIRVGGDVKEAINFMLMANEKLQF